MKTSAFILTLLFSLVSTSLWANNSFSVYLVRHAEKASDGTRDPALTQAGQQRAKNLAELLKEKNIEAIYSTDYKRTKQTAVPIAKKLKQDVIVYQMKNMADMVKTIKSFAKNTLIIGHSNTTLSFVSALGGQPGVDIDDAEYDRLYHLTIEGDKVTTQLLRYAPKHPEYEITGYPVDLDRFREGEVTFQMKLNGNVVGHSTQRFKRQSNQIMLEEVTRVPQFKIDSTINVSLEQKTLAPKAMTMSGQMGQPVEIQLQWGKDKVKGHSTMTRNGYKPQGKLSIDQSYSASTMERSSAIMLAHLLKVDKQYPTAFNWYNAYDNQQRPIQVIYQGEETITVPAGTFKTTKIKLLGGAPSQLFYITQSDTPLVVKIDVLHRPWSYELVKSNFGSSELAD